MKKDSHVIVYDPENRASVLNAGYLAFHLRKIGTQNVKLKKYKKFISRPMYMEKMLGCNIHLCTIKASTVINRYTEDNSITHIYNDGIEDSTASVFSGLINYLSTITSNSNRIKPISAENGIKKARLEKETLISRLQEYLEGVGVMMSVLNPDDLVDLLETDYEQVLSIGSLILKHKQELDSMINKATSTYTKRSFK